MRNPTDDHQRVQLDYSLVTLCFNFKFLPLALFYGASVISLSIGTAQTFDRGSSSIDSSRSLTIQVYPHSQWIPWSLPLNLNAQYIGLERSRMSTAGLRERIPSLDRVAVSRLDEPKALKDHKKITKEVTSPEFKIPQWEFNGEFTPETCLSHTWRHSANGFLVNGVRMKSNDLWITRRYKNYATPETVNIIEAGVRALRKKFPKAPRLVIGDLSARFGGHLLPHVSHQSGQDADIGYFVKRQKQRKIKTLIKVKPRQLDVAKTWTFLYGMLKTNLVEAIFIDYHLQRRLYRYAKSQGVSMEELGRYFSYPVWKGKVISHLKGHDDHMHVRFKAPQSTLAAKTYMKRHGRRGMRPRPIYYRVKSKDSLTKIARRQRVSWRRVLRWNRMTRSQGRSLKRGKKLIVGFKTPHHVRSINFKPKQVAVRTMSTHDKADAIKRD